MQAIRSIYTVEDQKLVIELPATFADTEVEVIILPVMDGEPNQSNAPNQASKAEKLEKLASVSVWDEADEQSVLESQNFINQWKIVEF
jgi:hypothetical protein